MSQLRISLFGRLCIQREGQALPGCEAHKARELLCYLLLHRSRPHAREALASLLWGDQCTTAQSKKYLRKALWQLQAALGGAGLLQIEPQWIELRPEGGLWLDVAVFEDAYAAVRGVPVQRLTEPRARRLAYAVELYMGYLLEQWYQRWCLLERERLHHVYLIMLDKLIAYTQAHRQYERGLAYGAHLLQFDRARECTHQHMMWLYAVAGHRTEALRQYDRCVAALEEDLGVGPAHSTVALAEQIRADRLDPLAIPAFSAGPELAGTPSSMLVSVVQGLKEVEAGLVSLQGQVRDTVEVAQVALTHQKSHQERT